VKGLRDEMKDKGKNKVRFTFTVLILFVNCGRLRLQWRSSWGERLRTWEELGVENVKEIRKEGGEEKKEQ